MANDGGDRERNRDAKRKREQAAAAKNVVIPQCEDVARRTFLEADDSAWLRWYCGELFWYDFTPQQREMIAAIRTAILFGGDQALAASRGEGKTKLFERLLLKYTLQGVTSFCVLFAATGSHAEDSLESIKGELETNDRLMVDYPEVCFPVRALENTPNRAHYQTVSGIRHDNGEEFDAVPSRFKWCGQEVVFPAVPGSPSCGAIIATRGLDSAVRGLSKRNRRPDVAGIDDPDTEETAVSEAQAAKLEKRIDRAIAGLGGQQRAIARVMLTTLQSRTCVSAKYTDPLQKPSWKGRRFRFLVKPPDRIDLWDEYIMQRRADMQSGDEFARTAHQFYIEHRDEMDAGAEVANPHRFDGQELADGTQLEASALQRYYNEVVRIGQDAVSCEYDNDPQEETGPQESGITAHRIQKQVSGYPRKIVPPGCTVLSQGIDVGKTVLYWTVRAWRPDATGYVIDYGVQDVHGTVKGSDEGVEKAIIAALETRFAAIEEDPYTMADGQIVPIDQSLIDARYKTDAIYHFCRSSGLGVSPVMGFGSTAGCVGRHFSPPQRSTQDKRVGGDGWYLARRPGLWLVCVHSDFWWGWEHARWLTTPTKPGSLMMYGEPSGRPDRFSDDEKKHFPYAKHLTAQIEIEEVVKSVMVRRWKSYSDSNHWGDASAYADAAAAMKGIQLLRTEKRCVTDRPSLADLAGRH